MPFRDAYTHFADIQEAVETIHDFVEDLAFEAYQQDIKTRSAVERQLQIISEAAIRLGDDGDLLAPGPDWKSVRGMGNILRHEYHRVDDRIVWNTVLIELPVLQSAVEKALNNKPRVD